MNTYDPDNLVNLQFSLEEEMRSNTRARYFSNHEKASERDEFAETHAGRHVLKHLLVPFIGGIRKWREEARSKPGVRATAELLMAEFNDDDALGYIFLRHVINNVLTIAQGGKGKQARKSTVVMAATLAIHDEFRMRYFEKNRRALLKEIVKDFNRRDLPRRRRRDLMIRQFNLQQLDWKAKGWEDRNRLRLGLQLLEILINSTGTVEDFIVFEGVSNRAKTVDCIAFTPEMVKKLEANMEAASNLFTVYYPTVIPPRPWKNNNLMSGGYYTTNVEPYRLIKNAKFTYLADLEATDLTDVLRPINAIQETPWRINTTMLSVLEEVWRRGIAVPGLPPTDHEVIPPAPPGIEENEELKKEYRKACYMVHDNNRRAISKRISVLRTISLANKFKEFPAIYFPHDLDSRGRAYPKPAFLNPQGTDYVKALLEFSEGMTIETEEDAAFLAIGIANAWGQDKRLLQERIDWVLDNEAMLLDVARDPIGDLRWTQADEPFMALRGAIEWANFASYGYGVVTRMPVHFDATCSGLQHFSALLRDEVGGFHVNLTSSKERQDIYGAVAEKATESLKGEKGTAAQIALEIGVSRALCKRPVMIVPYSGTFSACMDYTLDHYRGLDHLPVDFGIIRKEVTPLVSGHVWQAIGSTVIAARGAMDWITKAARQAAKGNPAPFQWTTPDGLVVKQEKYEEQERRIVTYLDGRTSKLTISEKTTKLDSRQMAQSLSPNYIHSLDACHLRMSVNAAIDRELTISFAMIHDSFGVHAPVMRRFRDECIKPAFVEMYAGKDLLAKFRDEIAVNLPEGEEFEPLPSMGTLDVTEVLKSEFFFS